MPAAGAGAGGVVEDQVALGSGAAPQPGDIEGPEFVDHTAGQRGRRIGIAPVKAWPQQTIRTRLEAHAGDARVRQDIQPLRDSGDRLSRHQAVDKLNHDRVKDPEALDVRG